MSIVRLMRTISLSLSRWERELKGEGFSGAQTLIPSPSPIGRREKANKLFIDPRSSDILTT